MEDSSWVQTRRTDLMALRAFADSTVARSVSSKACPPKHLQRSRRISENKRGDKKSKDFQRSIKSVTFTVTGLGDSLGQTSLGQSGDGPVQGERRPSNQGATDLQAAANFLVN